MDLQPYVENIQCELVVAAEAVGDDARALAERLLSPLESAIRLTLQDALVAAAEEITVELAPGSVDLRLRGRDPEFVVVPAPVDASPDDHSESDDVGEPAASGAAEADDGAVSRINLRLPDQLKARVERAAAAEGLSVNSWLVRAATAMVDRQGSSRGPGFGPGFGPGPWREARGPRNGQRYTGWAR